MSGPCLEDHVEWRFRCLPHAAKSALRDRGTRAWRTRLRPERRSDRLIERSRHADHRRTGIHMRLTGLRLSCNRSPAAGSTIIQRPSAFSDSRTWRAAPTGSPMSCKQSKNVTRSRSFPGKSPGERHLEPRVRSRPRPAWRVPRLRDRRRMKVVADEGRFRERLRHDDRRKPVPAPDVSDPRTRLELGDYPVQRRQPRLPRDCCDNPFGRSGRRAEHADD